jgi:hypothetical protein
MAGHPEQSFVVFCREDGTGNRRNRFFTEENEGNKGMVNGALLISFASFAHFRG